MDYLSKQGGSSMGPLEWMALASLVSQVAGTGISGYNQAQQAEEQLDYQKKQDALTRAMQQQQFAQQVKEYEGAGPARLANLAQLVNSNENYKTNWNTALRRLKGLGAAPRYPQ